MPAVALSSMDLQPASQNTAGRSARPEARNAGCTAEQSWNPLSQLSAVPSLPLTTSTFGEQWWLCHFASKSHMSSSFGQVIVLGFVIPNSGIWCSTFPPRIIGLYRFSFGFFPPMARAFSSIIEYSSKLILKTFWWTIICFTIPLLSVTQDIFWFSILQTALQWLCAHKSLSIFLTFPRNGFLERGWLS